MIEIENLVKTYKRRKSKKKEDFEVIKAVDNINLKVNKGEIFGIIGLNGAGKTTTLKILSTLILPDSGSVKIDGYDVIKDEDIVRKKISLLTSEYSRTLYWRLSGLENLRFFADLRSIENADERINEIADLFNLNDYKNERIMKYSTGMKHKLVLAIGLLHDPTVLFLDEPLTGIDPAASFELKNLIKSKFRDKTIIWASHNLFEIEEMCDRIAILNKGRIVLEGKPETLKKNYWSHTKIALNCNKPDEFKSHMNAEITGNAVYIKTNDVKKTFKEIVDIANIYNIEIFDIRTLKPTLEDIFLEGIKHDI